MPIYVCPKCGYKAPEQPVKVSEMSHRCPKDRHRQVVLKEVVQDG